MEKSEFYKQYARIVVSIGLNVQHDQEVVIRAPVEAVAFVPYVVAEAYERGARFVHVFYSHQDVTRARVEHAREETLSLVPDALISERVRIAQNGGAGLAILGEDPMGLDGVDATRLGRVHKALAHAATEYRELAMKDHFPWCVISVPNPAWAARVFPDHSPEEALEALFAAVARSCRLDTADPVAAWNAHTERLNKIAAWLTGQAFDRFHYSAPGTELEIGMPDRHVWLGAQSESAQGVIFTANIPTDEVFSAPDWRRVAGTIQSTRPLVLGGVNVGTASFTVEGGKIVRATSERGQEMLDQELDLDDRARYFGEIALVSEDAPIARERTTFYDGLYDENAGCHLAFGSAYGTCIADGRSMSEAEKQTAGLNTSSQHHDFTVGSAKLQITAYGKDGSEVPILRDGMWSAELLSEAGV